jgi:hypothetical protein
MSKGPNKRDLAKAEKEADVIMQSLNRASESAVATTLASITSTLQGNTPLMYHIHALLHNEDWRAVLEASAVGAGNTSGGEQTEKVKKLRLCVKKFEHLTRPCY